ncbi:unnamed protein product [Rotaria sordida]|uniref:Uncharacterized protein n=1 Tax=Rotaria sordida TaxID=392033 RepID=A0A818TXN3_9BILA|nr:unnamed protein product [Rotaria sordida]
MAKQLATCNDDDKEISDNDTFDYDHEFFDHDPFFDERENRIIGIESFTECEYEVKLLFNGDTLTRTQERSTYETLLRELIIFKEEFDDNEQALISSQFWNSIKRFEIRCAGPICIHYNLNELTMKYLRNYTIEYLLLDVGHLPLPSIYECLNFQELCFLMITRDFISKIRNARHVHLIIINEDNLKKLLNASEWTRLTIICHQLKKTTLQLMRSILEDQQLTKKITKIQRKLHNESYPPVQRQFPFSSSQWEQFVSLLDLETFTALADRIGCPGCADGGIEWIQVDWADATKRVTFESGQLFK